MFGYATALRSNSQGRANYTMQFSHYDTCPKSIAEEIIKKRTYKSIILFYYLAFNQGMV